MRPISETSAYDAGTGNHPLFIGLHIFQARGNTSQPGVDTAPRQGWVDRPSQPVSVRAALRHYPSFAGYICVIRVEDSLQRAGSSCHQQLAADRKGSGRVGKSAELLAPAGPACCESPMPCDAAVFQCNATPNLPQAAINAE